MIVHASVRNCLEIVRQWPWTSPDAERNGVCRNPWPERPSRRAASPPPPPSETPSSFAVTLPLMGTTVVAARALLRALGGVVRTPPASGGPTVVTDRAGRTWSLTAGAAGSATLVSPVLQGASGLVTLGAVVRALRVDGVRADEGRALAVDVDVADMDGAALERLRLLVVRYGPLLLHALGVPEARRGAPPPALRPGELRRYAAAQKRALSKSAPLRWAGGPPSDLATHGFDRGGLLGTGFVSIALGGGALHSGEVSALVQRSAAWRGRRPRRAA